MSQSISFTRALVAAGLSAVLALGGCGGGGSGGGPTVSRVEVTPTNPSIAKGTTQQFTATAVLSDGTTQDVTSSSTWTSSDTNAATVSNATGSEGLTEGVAQGTSTISASYRGQAGSTTLTVTAAIVTSLAVTPTNPSIAKGTNQQFTATATFSDSTTQNVTAAATWASSDTAAATVSNASGSQGVAQGLAQGSSTISANYQGKSASTTLTVTDAVLSSIEVDPASTQIPVGRTQPYTATGIYSDGSKQDITASATWSSSDTSVISISNASPNNGIAAANAVGTATISADFDGQSGSTSVEVTSAVLTSIQISPQNVKLAKEFTRAYTATGVYSDGTSRDITTDVLWGTTNNNIATISNANGSEGLATGVTAGLVDVTAELSGVKQKTPLTITDATLDGIQISPLNQTIPNGAGVTYKATGTFSDNSTQDLTTQVTWASSNEAVATVSNADGSKGQAQSVSAGAVDITATAANTAQTQGTTKLTVTTATLQSISVTRGSAELPVGHQEQFSAIGNYSDGSTLDLTAQVTWSSSDFTVATVSNASSSAGVVTGQASGQATISANYLYMSGSTPSSMSGSAGVTVTDAVLDSIAIAPKNANETGVLHKGSDRQYVATGTYSDGTTRDVTAEATWKSSDETVATISNAADSPGLAHAVDAGQTDIDATIGSVTSPAITLEVDAAILSSIAITPADPQVPAGLEQQLKATGTYTDGTTGDVTATVTWTSSDSSIVEVHNEAGAEGTAYAVSPGTVTITATSKADSTKKATTSFTVTAAILNSIAVTPSNAATAHSADIPVNYYQQFTATGSYSDNVPRDITSQVDWQSLDPSIISIDTSGYARAEAAGTTSVTATLNGVSGTASTTAVVADLLSISVTPKNDSFALGETKQFTATGTFSSGGTLDMTRQVTWASSNPAVATISNASGSQGLATAQALPASTTISAATGNFSDSTSLNVTP